MYISVPHSLCQSYSLLKWSWHFRPKRHMMYEVQTTASNTNNKKNISVIIVALIVSGLSTFQLFWLLSSCRACPNVNYSGCSHRVGPVQRPGTKDQRPGTRDQGQTETLITPLPRWCVSRRSPSPSTCPAAPI